MSSRQLLKLAAVISGLTVCGAALATPSTITMNFDSLSSGTSVGNYYDGVGGPDYGVVWNGAQACSSGGCSSGLVFTGEPSSPNALEISFQDWAMNVPAGFTGDFSFYYYYAPHNFAQEFTTDVWSELNGLDNYGPAYGGSTVLASQEFSSTPPDPDCYISGCWQQASMTFSGIAESVEFLYDFGTENIVLDDVAFTPAPTSVPEPGSLAMLGLGLVGLGFFASRKRRAM